MKAVGKGEQPFEPALAELVSQARTLPTYFWHAFSRDGLEVKHDDFPRYTLYKLNLVAGSNFEAAIVLLLDVVTAFATPTLLRPLIETWTHVDFIEQGGYDDARCRALRLEVGMAECALDLAESFQPVDEEDVAMLKTRRDKARAMCESSACQGEPRGWWKLQPDIARIAEREDAAILRPMWKGASMLAHGFGDDFLMYAMPDGRLGPRGVPPRARAAWFHHAVTLYANIAVTSLRAADLGDDFPHALVHSLRNAPVIVAAISGEYD